MGSATHYETGEEVRTGDHIRYAGEPAVVQFVNGSPLPAEWDEPYWATLGPGFMIRGERVGPIFLPEADEDTDFVRRGA